MHTDGYDCAMYMYIYAYMWYRDTTYLEIWMVRSLLELREVHLKNWKEICSHITSTSEVYVIENWKTVMEVSTTICVYY